jgi:hypothetical protein
MAYPLFLVKTLHDNFGGNRWTIAGGGFLWAVVTELPGIPYRQAAAYGSFRGWIVRPLFDWVLFAFLTAVEIGVVFATIQWPPQEEWSRGLVWGVSTVAMVDLARTAIAATVAGFDGYPLYPSYSESW